MNFEIESKLIKKRQNMRNWRANNPEKTLEMGKKYSIAFYMRNRTQCNEIRGLRQRVGTQFLQFCKAYTNLHET